MPILSLEAGISGDEKVHYEQSEKVLNYYKTFGKDKSALNTPTSHLKHYGQSFDNLIVPGTVNSATPGGHQLPVASKLIAVPPQAVVTIEIIDDIHQQL